MTRYSAHNKRTYADNKTGLLLTGGGARAAYQVGVLKGIASFIPRNHGTPFPILCGTSAGAINGTALACYASCYHLGVKKLEWVWRNFSIDQVYHSHIMAMIKQTLRNLLRNTLANYADTDPPSLFDNSPLRDLIMRVIDFERIDRNLASGYLSAISVTASNYNSGKSISFFQAVEETQEWVRARRQGKKTLINIEHLMASSAIPLVFPSVNIKHNNYGDGSVHQLSPLSPAIHLGAEKIFVIGVEQPKQPDSITPNDSHPTSAMIAGHLLDTIFADTLNSDIERMQRINRTLSLLHPDDHQKINLKPIETLVINPSHDFNSIAFESYDDFPFGVRRLFQLMGISRDSKSSLPSYLLFEKKYCSQLMNLGLEDALAKKHEILNFLNLD